MIFDEGMIQLIMLHRVEQLKKAISQVSKSKRARRFKGIQLLTDIFNCSNGALQKLELKFVKARTGSSTYLDWNEIDRGHGATFRIHSEIVQKFLEVANQSERVGPRRDYWHFDLFLIHELLHSFQGMERGKHSGYQNRSPSILNVLDYEADAVAVTTLFLLTLLAPEYFFGRFAFLPPTKSMNSKTLSTAVGDLARNALLPLAKIIPYWGTLVRILHAQIWHLSVFTAAMVDTKESGRSPDKSLEIASDWNFPLSKLERTFAWYLQYYRARFFLIDGRIDELGLLKQPLVEFRNLRLAAATDGKYLRRNWPKMEATFIKAAKSTRVATPKSQASATNKSLKLREPLDDKINPQLIIGVQGQYGMMRILRWHEPNISGIYGQLFEALFTGEIDKASAFFLDLIGHNPWLIGFYDNPILGLKANTSAVSKALSKKRDQKPDYLNLSDPKVRQQLLRDFDRLH